MIRESLRLTPCPNIDNCSWIWIASSRLGTTITAYILNGYLDRFWIKGRPKAAVLPDPVSELIIADFP